MHRDSPKLNRNEIIEEILLTIGEIKSKEILKPIIIIDKKGQILFISKPAGDLLENFLKSKISSGESIFKIISDDKLWIFGEIIKKVFLYSEEQNFSLTLSGNDVELILNPVFDSESQVNNIQIDVNVRVEEVKDSLQKIVEQSLDIILTIDESGTFIEVSAASLKILGYLPNELKGKKYLDFMYSEDKENAKTTELRIRAGEDRPFISNRFIHKNGSLVPLIWSAKWDAAEKLMYCIGKDASELQEIEMKSQEERSMLRAIIDNIPDYIFVVDQNHKTILTNKKFYSDYLGKNCELETLNLSPVNYNSKEDGLEIIADNKRVMETGIPVINRRDIVYDHKGNKDIILLTKVPFKDEKGRVSGLVGIARNITDSYNLEQEQEFVYKLIKSLGTAETLDGAFKETIQLIAEFLQFDAAEAWEVGYDNSKLLRCAWYYHQSGINLSQNKEYSFSKGEGLPGITWRKKNIQVWHNLSEDERSIRKEFFEDLNLNLGIGVPIIFNSEVIAVLTFFGNSQVHPGNSVKTILQRLTFQISNDIQRKITENRLNDLFIHSPNLIAVVGKNGYLKKVNPAFTRVLGYSEEELLNTPLERFLHLEEIEETLDKLREVTQGGTPGEFQNRLLTKDGDWKWISWTPSRLLEKGIVHIFGVDVTAIKSTNLELLKYKNIIESSRDFIGLYSIETREIFLNDAFKKILGFEETDLVGDVALEKVYVDVDQAHQIFKTLVAGFYWEGDIRIKGKDGALMDYHFRGGPIYNNNKKLIAIFAIHTDISDRKKYELSTRENAVKIENILESITDGFFSLNTSWEVTYWNNAAEKLLGISRDQILNQNLWDHFPIAKTQLFYSNYAEAMREHKQMFFEDYLEPQGIWFEVNVYPGEDGLSVFFKDITLRKIAESEIKMAKDRYDLVARATREAVYDWNIEANNLLWSKSYYEIYGYSKTAPEETLLQWEMNIHYQDRNRVLEKLNESLNSQDEEWNCEYRLLNANRKIAVILERGFIVRDKDGKAIRMIGSLQDITELTQNERALEELNFKLEKHSQELALSNAELEQFAYIASHDLQEPLRMVTGFLTQLERKYQDQLDEKAREYIHFATDGAIRMRQIILDLLDYSRVGKLNYTFEEINLNNLLKDILALHENIIKETGTNIKFKELPVIRAAVTPLQRVFSNLITNSIKYRKGGVDPAIHIMVNDNLKEWEIIVRDNGIGIDPVFHEKIFVIFQRLHSRDQYSGTGIGLAICKKIVENHGGRIWLNSKEGEGSSFHFTIQKHF